jgi:SAM-dependent methyltransferase
LEDFTAEAVSGCKRNYRLIAGIGSLSISEITMASTAPEMQDILRWPLSIHIRPEVLNAMNQRAKAEHALVVAQGADIVQIHGETLRRYSLYQVLLNAAVLFARYIGRPLNGSVADLGSGVGIGAALLSQLSSVGRVYAVEYSEGYVEYIRLVAELGWRSAMHG